MTRIWSLLKNLILRKESSQQCLADFFHNYASWREVHKFEKKPIVTENLVYFSYFPPWKFSWLRPGCDDRKSLMRPF